MKKIFLTTLIFSVVSCSVPEVPMDSIVERNGIIYQVNSDKPYSGKAIAYYANGQADVIYTYKKGKIAQAEQYYKNGQLERIETFKNEKPFKIEAFLENGTPIFKEALDKNGKIIGEEYFYDNGQLDWKWSCEGVIENDICPYEEYIEHDENGQLRYKATYKNGNVVDEEEYNENGKKIDASNY
jgi:antitoxin component YwqK of YwqJK toxin-antitoxin module